MTKGIIYYTDNKLPKPISSAVQKLLLITGLPIVSVSLKPIKFGNNIVFKGKPGYTSMVNQIITALEKSTAKTVFFCEHDVLYHKSHFDFTPSRNDTYYYNINNWRWDYPNNRLIKYDGLTYLSQLSADRKLALGHFRIRLSKMKEVGLNNFKTGDPRLARVWGYEPGKKKRNGGLTDEKTDTWSSKYPNIDIRHQRNFSMRKVSLRSFINKPTGWMEMPIDKIPGWDLGKLFIV